MTALYMDGSVLFLIYEKRCRFTNAIESAYVVNGAWELRRLPDGRYQSLDNNGFQKTMKHEWSATEVFEIPMPKGETHTREELETALVEARKRRLDWSDYAI